MDKPAIRIGDLCREYDATHVLEADGIGMQVWLRGPSGRRTGPMRRPKDLEELAAMLADDVRKMRNGSRDDSGSIPRSL